MKMKRIMALVMTSAMVMGTLAGCGASTDTTSRRAVSAKR